MKLFTITNRYYLIALLIVFTIGGVFGYFVLKFIINSEFNEKLMADKNQLMHELRNYEELEENYYLNIGDRIDLKVVENDPKIESTLRDTVMFDEYENKILPYRTLIFSEKLNNRFYIVSITKSLLPNEDLMRGMAEILVLLLFDTSTA